MVFPYSNDFSNRKLAYDATTRLTRILSYQLHLPFRAVSEYELAPLEAELTKLILLPSVHNLDNDALQQLLDIVERTGAVLLITGALGVDAYWQPSDRMDAIVGARKLGNMRREEQLLLNGRKFAVSYGQKRIAELVKETPANADVDSSSSGGVGDHLIERQLGTGRLIWCPLPLELNDRDEPIAALYQYAAQAAGIETGLEWISGGDLPGVYGRKLAFAEGSLYIFVSEYAWDAELEIKDPATGAHYSFLLEKERSVLFAADSAGKLVAVYRPEEVNITLNKC